MSNRLHQSPNFSAIFHVGADRMLTYYLNTNDVPRGLLREEVPSPAVESTHIHRQ